MQQTRSQINKLLFFKKDARHASGFVYVIAIGTFLLSFLFLTPLASASQTNGTISSTYKYAWSNVGGYINFAPTKSIISVTDTGISGYAWSENDGWINLSPSGGGVTNNGNGVLGGSAWDTFKGWVSFTGVTIDSSGRFHGKAVGIKETISFDCANCDVRTDWRPISARTPTVTTNNGFIGGFNTVNQLPGENSSTTKMKQTVPTLSNTIPRLHTTHNIGPSTQITGTVTKQPTTSTTNVTTSFPSSPKATTTQAIKPLSYMRKTVYIYIGILLLLLLLVFTRRFLLRTIRFFR